MIKPNNFVMLMALACIVNGPMVFSEDKAPTPDSSAVASPIHKAKPKKKAKAISANKKNPAPTGAKVIPVKKSINSAALDAWLKKMKDKLSKNQTKNNRLVAVAAVRGNETKDAPPLYWKGLKTEGPINEAELSEFQTAVDLASSGDKKTASDKLQAFVTAYPKSPMMEDAKETLDILSKEPTPEAQ